MTQLLLTIQNLHKSYGDLDVLKGLDIEIQAGEKVVLIGPSGSGKSTLLRVLMTLESPDQGAVLWEGVSVWTTTRKGHEVPTSEEHLRNIRNNICMVFQQYNLFPHKSVLDNITLAPRLVLNKPEQEAKEQAYRLLKMVGLYDKAHAFPGQLSGGQQQRVAIARALATQPQLLLFDEITSALDPELVQEVQEVLHQLAHEWDITMLLVTHEMQFARDIATRVLFFDEGQIVEEGPPQQIFTTPQHQRTHDFLRSFLPEHKGNVVTNCHRPPYMIG